jgi:hypothetical protein
VLALAMLLVAPAALAVAWAERIVSVQDYASARIVAWVGTFGLVTGLATTLYLAALRRRATGRPDWAAFLVVGGIGVLAVVAVSLQAFTYPRFLTGTRAAATRTPLAFVYDEAFRFGQFGRAAAANVLLLLVLGLVRPADWCSCSRSPDTRCGPGCARH